MAAAPGSTFLSDRSMASATRLQTPPAILRRMESGNTSSDAAPAANTLSGPVFPRVYRRVLLTCLSSEGAGKIVGQRNPCAIVIHQVACRNAVLRLMCAGIACGESETGAKPAA